MLEMKLNSEGFSKWTADHCTNLFLQLVVNGSHRIKGDYKNINQDKFNFLEKKF